MRTIKNIGVQGSVFVMKTVLLVLLAASITFGGCATPDDIDRVQPDLIEKSTLQGEWYLLDTVVRAPYASHDAFIGLQGTLDRGVWEIEEKALYFYRTYEFVEGIESQGIKGDTDAPLLDEDGEPQTYTKLFPDGVEREVTRYIFRSSPIARYEVLGHYDVRRKYNAATGEESNVTIEDTSEKYWYQRDYVRVNFGNDTSGNAGRVILSQNAQTVDGQIVTVAFDNVYEGEEGPEEIKLRVQDDGTYMDFVVRGWMLAPQTYFGSWGWLPTCVYYPWYTGSFYECGEEEIHIRTAYMKVPESNTYKPLAYDDQMLNRFGFYRSARAHHDQFYGRTYSDVIRNARRFRIWEDYIDADGDGQLEYDQMTPKPIVYYLSDEFPRELVPGAVDLADQWNAAFVDVVKALKPGWEGRMFVLCENSAEEVERALADDPNGLLADTNGHCEDMGRRKLLGDLRYNILSSVNDPTQYGLYGYGPMHSDPITGEIIQANAFNYTANMRLGARNAVDMIEYEAGVQDFRDIAFAQHITTKMKAKQLKISQGSPRREISMDEALSVADGIVIPEVAETIKVAGLVETDMDHARISMSPLANAESLKPLWVNEDSAAMLGIPVQELGTQPDDDGLLHGLVNPVNFSSEDTMLWQTRRDASLGKHAICMGDHFDDAFGGLALEYRSVYDEALCEGLAGRDDLVFDFSAFREPGARCDGQDGAAACGEGEVCTSLNQGSEVSGKYCITTCSSRALLDQLRRQIRRVNQISEFDYWDPSALYADTKDARVTASQIAAREIIEEIREKVFLEVFGRIWSTVAIHEVGHNLGLRHNFASSTDALNYFPEYWDIKGSEDRDGHWHPVTLYTRDTRDQTVAKMREFQQSSIMEYSTPFNGSFQGVGSYDRAAILYGYGELVEVFDEPPAFGDWEELLEEPSDEDPTMYTLYPRREQPLARALRKLHHTNVPELFGGVDRMLNRTVVPADSLADKTKPCTREDSPYDWTVCETPGSFCQPFPSGFFCSKADTLEVPYRFCSDEYNWDSPTCQTRDEGVDMFEIVTSAIDDYEEYWPFRAYKRDSVTFNPGQGMFPLSGYWGYAFSQMLIMRKHFEHWAYNYARYNHDDWWERKFGVPWHADVNGGLGDTLAVKEIFGFVSNVFGRPSDAYYGWNNEREQYEPVVNNGKNTYTNIFEVREDTGARPIYPSYTFEGYLYQPLRAGTFYDRWAALKVMTYPQMLFMGGVDRSYDSRRFNLSLVSIWPQRTQNLLAGLITGDPKTFGWCVEHDGIPPTEGGTGDPLGVKPRLWFGTDTEIDDFYSNCVPLQPEPEYDFPTTQYRMPAITAVHAMAESWKDRSRPWDRSFMDRTRIWLVGEGNDLSVPDGFESITYTDPFSGRTYLAPYDPAEFDPAEEFPARRTVPLRDVGARGHTYWPGAYLLSEANKEKANFPNQSALTDEYPYSRLQQLTGRIEILRGLHAYFEYGKGDPKNLNPAMPWH